MEKGRSSKMIAIVALCVGVVGLSLGFAAFSSTLTISSSASVSPDASTFNVDFSTKSTEVDTTSAVSVTNASSLEVGTPSIDNATNPKITGLSAKFTEPGQEVVYTFYTYNAGELVGYLDSITPGAKTCTAVSGTSQALVDSACTGISMTVTVDGVEATTTAVTGIKNHAIAVGGNHEVTVKLAYAAGSARADGDFNVTFGDVTLMYESVDNQ